jgi:hypothetical protein
MFDAQHIDDLIAQTKAAASAMLGDLDLPGAWTPRQRDAYAVRRVRMSIAPGELINRWHDVREWRAVRDDKAKRFAVLLELRKDFVRQLLAPELQHVRGGPLRILRDSLEIAIKTIDGGLTYERTALVPLLADALRERGYADGWDGFESIGGPAGLFAERRMADVYKRVADAECRLADAVLRADAVLAEDTVPAP